MEHHMELKNLREKIDWNSTDIKQLMMEYREKHMKNLFYEFALGQEKVHMSIERLRWSGMEIDGTPSSMVERLFEHDYNMRCSDVIQMYMMQHHHTLLPDNNHNNHVTPSPVGTPSDNDQEVYNTFYSAVCPLHHNRKFIEYVLVSDNSVLYPV
ncbi:hypothetical protein EB796_021583 [Bugula neritina]|uniref:Uncharacterized protein n=1 Tax=Bugula neritina TaxID=10212 RepID=A0A7J7J2Z0_BUGNE|nr:hypothetical protein EB796_021583 [Bugula neritina]